MKLIDGGKDGLKVREVTETQISDSLVRSSTGLEVHQPDDGPKVVAKNVGGAILVFEVDGSAMEIWSDLVRSVLDVGDHSRDLSGDLMACRLKNLEVQHRQNVGLPVEESSDSPFEERAALLVGHCSDSVVYKIVEGIGTL